MHRGRHQLSKSLLITFLIATSLFLASANNNVAAIMRCFAGHDCLTSRMSWNHILRGMPSCYVAVRVWWSEQPSSLPITLVTHLSANRLDQLQVQCANWQGPLAAAVYLPLMNPSRSELTPENRVRLQQALMQINAIYRAAEQRRQESGRGCQLRVLLMYELFAEPRGVLLYPVDTLRNYARLLADTELITDIDVDMMPSSTIFTELSDPATLAEYTENCRKGSVYVWPAFEAHCGEVPYAEQVAAGGKEMVADALKKCLQIYHPTLEYQQNATDYPLWLSTKKPYRIPYQPKYEPWFMSWRWNTLWFDFRFRGYGRDKMVHSAATNKAGATWLVSGTGYLVHRTHNDSGALELKRFVPIHQALDKQQDAIMNASLADISSGRYRVRLEPAFQACLESLPWWRQPASTDKL